MPSELQSQLDLARLLGTLYTEVFQRKKPGDNKPLSKASHKQDRMTLKEDTFTVLAESTAVYKWGQSGVSHHTTSGSIQGVWGEGGYWG